MQVLQLTDLVENDLDVHIGVGIFVTVVGHEVQGRIDIGRVDNISPGVVVIVGCLLNCRLMAAGHARILCQCRFD